MTDTDTPDDPAALRAQLEALQADNRRLRNAYATATQTRYRHTALALLALGLINAGAGVIFVGVRDILFAIAAIGIFGGVLVWFLTPESVITADVGERTYAAMADNLGAIADHLGLAETYRYVPYDTGTKLVIPAHPEAHTPADPTEPFATDADERGLVLEPTGAGLVAALARASTGDLASEPPALAEHLADGATEQFELADHVDIDIDSGRLTVAVSGSTMGELDRPDHPLPSLFATGMAEGLGVAVDLEVTRGDRADWLITCRWEPHDIQ